MASPTLDPIEAAGRRILFDTGQGRRCSPNARRLGVALEAVDAIVKPRPLRSCRGPRDNPRDRPRDSVFLHPGALIRASASCEENRPGGSACPPRTGPPWNERRPAGHARSSRRRRSAPRSEVTGPIPRETGEDAGGRSSSTLSWRAEGSIEDDQALWIGTPEGVIVCAGCSRGADQHPAVRAAGGGIPEIRAVIGGFHLLHADDRRMAMTIGALRSTRALLQLLQLF